MQRKPIIRAFDGSLADAEGLLAVEKATRLARQGFRRLTVIDDDRIETAIATDQAVIPGRRR